VLIDLVIIALTIAVGIWGYIRGFSAGGLALIGFGAGVVLGSRVAPLILDGGLRDPYAPHLALPGALLFGAIIAAVLERFAYRVRRPMLRFGAIDGVAGALVTACLGLVVVWAVGAVAVRVDGFRDTVRDSSVVDNLNAVLPPAGPLLKARTEFAPLPVIAGPPARVGAANPNITRDAQVKRAARSVVKVTAVACDHQVNGSGWIARSGIVVTNAHVVAGSEDMRVQLEGEGMPLEAKPIWYDRGADIAVLAVPRVTGVPPLRIAPGASAGTQAAVLGFPGGGAYRVRPARIGGTAKIPGRRYEKSLLERKVTSIRAIVRPGNSGGPVIDGRGRAVTMIFAGQKMSQGTGGHTAYGVPIAEVRLALKRARGPVDTGNCDEGEQ